VKEVLQLRRSHRFTPQQLDVAKFNLVTVDGMVTPPSGLNNWLGFRANASTETS